MDKKVAFEQEAFVMRCIAVVDRGSVRHSLCAGLPYVAGPRIEVRTRSRTAVQRALTAFFWSSLNTLNTPAVAKATTGTTTQHTTATIANTITSPHLKMRPDRVHLL